MITDIQGEEWLPVRGFQGLYDVSTKGRIATYRTKGSNKVMPYRQRLMSLQIGPHGYLQVVLRHDGKKRQVRVHRLVLETFVGPCPSGMESFHRNGDKVDNRISNLKWATHRENQMEMHSRTPHSVLFRDGESNPSAKLSSSDVATIKLLAATLNYSQDFLARRFGVGRREIGRILDGTRRKNG